MNSFGWNLPSNDGNNPPQHGLYPPVPNANTVPSAPYPVIPPNNPMNTFPHAGGPPTYSPPFAQNLPAFASATSHHAQHHHNVPQHHPHQPFGGTQQWVAGSNGSVPANAVIAGKETNGEPVYVARARHSGALIPGKLIASHGGCYVAWGGNENLINHYEVLCNTHGDWYETKKEKIPDAALEGGYSESGERLYIGRVKHKGSVAVGKVQPSHKCCYIPYAGKEIAYKGYDIFVVKKHKK